MDTEDRDRLADLTAALVRIESENPPGNEQECGEFIADWCRSHGIDVRTVAAPEETRPQVVARVGAGAPTVVLNGHIDVVPVTAIEDWSHDPYGAERSGTTLYGRGAADMKAGLAVAMCALADLRDPLAGDRNGSLVFHAAIGEETGDSGTKTLLERGFDGDYGIVLEPTDLRVATAAKGLAVYEITVPGRSSHASRPEQGTNPISATVPLLEAIDDYDASLESRTHDLVGRAYATVTRCVAGADSNAGVIPGGATLTLDRRLLPGESVADVDEEVRSLLAAVDTEHGVETRWRRVQQYSPAEVPGDCELATRIREHAAAVADAPGRPWGIEAATDVRNLVNDAGMEAVTWGPGSLAQAHTVDEHVDIGEVAAGLEILENTVCDLLECS